MPIATPVLRAHVVDDVDDDITVYLHTGDPGTAGTANRVGSSALPSRTIMGTDDWTIHATNAHAQNTEAISFGNAQEAVTGISHYSLFKGSTLYGTRAFAAPMNAALGAPVNISAGSIVIEYTSTDA